MALGVFLVVICSLTLSFGAAVGINIQKMSMVKEAKKKDDDDGEGDGNGDSNRSRPRPRSRKRPPHLQPLWCLGMAIIIIDAIGDFVFIGLAPQSLLAPLGSFSLGWNIILAPKFNPSEKATKGIVVSTAVIYVGTLMTVLFAPNVSPTYDLVHVVSLVSNTMFHIYFGVCLVFLGSTVYHGRRNGYDIIHYSGLAGCLGGLCVLSAKTTSELVKNAIVTGNRSDFTTSFLPYVFILSMIVTVLTQITCLNTGLAKFETLIVIPVYRSFWNVFGLTGGLIFFQEYKYMTVRDSVIYALGLCITLKGVAMLVKERRGRGGGGGTVLKYRHVVE